MKKSKIIPLNINCDIPHIMSEGAYFKDKYYKSVCALRLMSSNEEKLNRYEYIVDWGVLW